MALTENPPSAAGHSWTRRWPDGTVLRGQRTPGEPLIHFLSGNGFCGGVYQPFLDRLRTQYGVWTHDLPGQGLSDAPKAFPGARDWLEQITAALDELPAGRKLIGIGHSFGGVLTVLAAAQRPERFSALVLLDPVMFPPLTYWGIRLATWTGSHPFARAARRRRRSWSTRKELLAYLEGRGIYAGWAPEALEAFADAACHETEGGTLELRCPPELEAQIYEQPAPAYWQAVAALAMPTLMLCGASSYPFMGAAMRRAQRRNPQLVAERLPGGHCFMQEFPADSAARVTSFLSGLAT